MTLKTIKPLVWEKIGYYTTGVVTHIIAETAFCWYKVHADNHGGYLEIDRGGPVEFMNCTDLEDGKAKAFAHHEKQVRELFE